MHGFNEILSWLSPPRLSLALSLSANMMGISQNALQKVRNCKTNKFIVMYFEITVYVIKTDWIESESITILHVSGRAHEVNEILSLTA